jgi:PAS domain S-box-containing protein
MPPPGLEHDHIGAALETALRTFMVAVLLLLGAVFLLPAYASRWLAIVAGLYAFAVPAWVANRRGRTRLASGIVVAGLWTLITAASLTAGGLPSLASSFFVVLVLASGLLLGARAAVVAAIVSVVTALAFLVAAAGGWLPWPPLLYTQPMRWLGLTLLIAMTAGLVHLTARAMRDALQRSDDLINAIDGIVWEADAKTFQFTFVSAQAERLLGYPCSRWLTEPTFWRDHIHPDDRDAAVTYCVNSTAMLQTHDFEYRFMAADGRAVWLRDLVTVLAEGGEPKTLRGIMVDITGHKRADELFRAVVEDQTEMIVRWKPDGTRTFVNRAYSHVFGGNPEDFIGTSFMPLVAENYREFIRDKIRSLTPDQPLATAIHESLAPDGEIRWQEWTDRGIFDAEGRLVELQSTGRDITERKRADEALRASTEQLRALSARLQSTRDEEGQRIAREIHDELGGALTGLQWDLRSIDGTLATVEARSELDGARERISGMMALLDSTLFTVKRISADLRPALLDDVGLIAAIQWHLQQFQSRTGILCDCETALDTVELDPERANAVFRICQEILTNVLRHAEATRVRVQIRQEDGCVVLVVDDNGRGITEDESLGARSLGLLGMRERALLVGGEIVVRGTPGRGTNVVVRVPNFSASQAPQTV